MHKATPDVNWRQIEAANAKQKWMNLSGSIVRTATSETFANSYILGTWVEKGTYNQTGRLLSCDYDKANDKLYFISGGNSLWRTPRAGNGWELLNDKSSFSNIIKLVPISSTKNRVLSAVGNQLVYSDDEGKTFQNSNMDYFYDFGTPGDMEVLNDANNTIYYVCRMWNTSPFGPSIMLFKSTDKGSSFQKILTLPDAPIKTVRLWKPTNQNFAFLMQQSYSMYKLLPETTVPTSQTMTGLLFANTSTSFFGVAKTSTRTMYAIQDGDQLYRSYNDGLDWQLVNTLPIKAGDAGGDVSQTDTTQIIIGEVEAYRSKDRGLNFTKVNSASEYLTSAALKLHADITSFKYFKDVNGTEFMVISTGGGAYISNNFGEATYNISMTGVNNTQYHETKTSPTDTSVIFAGARDQGIQKSATIGANGLLNFTQLKTGNYGKMAYSLGGKKLYAQAPNGVIDYFPNSQSIVNLVAKIPGTYRPNSGWMFPICDNGNPASNSVFIGGGDLNNGDGSYLIRLSVTDDSNPGAIKTTRSQFNFDFKANSQDGKSGISAVAVSPVDTNRIYVATADGTLFYSTNRGTDWQKSNGFTGPVPQAFNGAVLYPSSINKNIVYFAGSGYSNAPVYRSTDGGTSFSSISSGMPSTAVFQLSAISDESLIIAATEAGPYAYIPSQNKWFSLIGTGTPIQAYWSVEYIAGSNTARFATYGRGIWDFRFDAVGNSILASKPTITSSSATNKICLGDSIKLTTSSTISNQWYLNGTLITGANKQTFYAKTSGIYTVRTLYNTGFLESNPIEIQVTSVTTVPSINSSGATVRCEGDSVMLRSDSKTIQWRLNNVDITGAVTDVFAAKKSGVYSAVNKVNGCASSASNLIKIEMNPVPITPVINYYSPLNICDGDSVVLYSTVLTGMYWINELASTTSIGSNPTFPVKQSGRYIAINNNGKDGCESKSKPVTIVNNSNPAPPTISWNGKELSTQTGYSKYQWWLYTKFLSDVKDYKFVPLASGFYKVSVVNAAGCADTSTIYDLALPRVWFDGVTVKVYPNPAPTDAFVEFSEAPNTSFSIKLISPEGRVLQNFKTKLKTNRLQVSGLAPGTYYVLLDNGKTIGTIHLVIPK